MQPKISETKIIESSGLPSWVADIYALPACRILDSASKKSR